MSKFNEDVILQEFSAEKVPQEKLPRIHCLSARITQNISILAPLKYAQEMKRRYQQIDSQELSPVTQTCLWLCLVIAAAMNSRAPYAALAGFPDEWRLLLAALVALPLTYFGEWAIAFEISLSNLQRDIRQDQRNIDAKHAKAQQTLNNLIDNRAEAEEVVFDAVLRDYLHQSGKRLMLFAVALLVVEYASTLFFIRFQGEDGDWITYIVPLLGIVLAVLTGLYTGHMIDYPKAKRNISQKFQQFFQQIYNTNPDGIKHATQEFWVLEGLTQFVLEYSDATPEQRQAREQQLLCDRLHHDYFETMKAWQAAVQAKKRESSQTAVGIIDVQERERQMQEEIRLIDEVYSLKIHHLAAEMQRRGCPIETQQQSFSNGHGAGKTVPDIISPPQLQG